MAAARRVPLALFLIADTGGGHRSAANAIRAAMDLIAPETFPSERPANLTPVPAAALAFDPRAYLPVAWGATPRPWRAEIRDIFQECGRFPLPQTVSLYGPVVETNPRLYAGFFHATNTGPTYTALAALTQSLLHDDLAALLRRLRPDVIVSVHPMLTRPTLRTLRQLHVHVPFVTVVTDLVKFHRAWRAPEVDACVVPTDAARDYLIALGMPPAKLHLLGMPIHPKFCQPPAGRAVTLRGLGLDPDRLTILLVGGGEGVGGLGEAAQALGASGLPIQQIVVTGRNHALFDRLTAQRATLGIPSAILGFVQTMPDLMRAADVVVTKAGPGTIAEALACELPIILTGAIPGQEVANIDYVVRNQVGRLAPTPAEVVEAARALCQPDSALLATMRANARRISRPRASFDIARLILETLPAARAVSPWAEVKAPPAPRLRRPRHMPVERRIARPRRRFFVPHPRDAE